MLLTSFVVTMLFCLIATAGPAKGTYVLNRFVPAGTGLMFSDIELVPNETTVMSIMSKGGRVTCDALDDDANVVATGTIVKNTCRVTVKPSKKARYTFRLWNTHKTEESRVLATIQ